MIHEENEHLLNHALDMYSYVQEYEILPAKAYEIIKKLNFLNKTDQAKSLHALQRLIGSKMDILDRKKEKGIVKRIRNEIKASDLLYAQLVQESVKIPNREDLLDSMAEEDFNIPCSLHGSIRKDFIKFLRVNETYSIQKSDKNYEILHELYNNKGTLTRKNMDILLQDAAWVTGECTMKCGITDNRKWVNFQGNEVFLE